MKKICILLLASILVMNLHAEIVLLNGLYYSLSSTTAQVAVDQTTDQSRYTTYTSVTIPATVTYNGYTYAVTSMASQVFQYCTLLESVTLPPSIKSISSDAFYGCNRLASVNLDEGLISIGARAFDYCNLSSVTIPSTVTSIGSSAFQNNPLTSVVWNAKECSISTDTYAPFYSTNSQITSFTFGGSVEVVPAHLCKNMTRLDTIVLPASVRSLGQYAFAYCSSLKSINLPLTQKSLPASIFEGCTSLESIVLPATLTTINQDAFYGCNRLASINLHEGITTIGTRAFDYCKLTSVTIPSTVTSIGSSAFLNNPLTSVVWLPKDCSIGTDTYAPFYSTDSRITSFTFGDSVEVVPAHLCKNMTRLDTIVLPPSVRSLGQYAFAYCTQLRFFEFPNGITTLTTSVLEGCTALEQVIIPESVSSINQDALYGCSALLAIYNYALTPQTIVARTLYNVSRANCVLYVPMDYIDLYQAKAVWCDFTNIIGLATGLHFEDQLIPVSYLKQDSTLHFMEVQHWQVPLAPRIQGFTFLRWEVQSGDLADGIVLKAIYRSDAPTGNAPAVVTDPANPARKLIRNGQIYILSDDKTYTIQGHRVE